MDQILFRPGDLVIHNLNQATLDTYKTIILIYPDLKFLLIGVSKCDLDDLMPIIGGKTTLQMLGLHGNVRDSSNLRYITSLRCLTHLRLCDKFSFKANSYEHFFQRLHNLTRLNNLELGGNGTHCVRDESMSLIKNLPQLMYLKIFDFPLVTDAAFQNCLALKTLHITNCAKVANPGLINLVRTARRLYKVQLNLCPEVNNTFITGALRALRSASRRSSDQRTLTVVARTTGITKHKADNLEQYILLSTD